MTISILLQQPLAPNAVPLGRLVLDISAPWQDFCPVLPELSPEVDVMSTPFLQFHELFERTRKTKFHANFSKAMNSLVSKGDRLTASVQSPQGSRFCLLNSGHHFERMCEDANVRRWFEDIITGGFDVYMVVGLIALKDTTVVRTFETNSVIQGEAQAPITEIVSSGLALLMPGAIGSILDSGMGGGRAAGRAIGARYFAPGDRIMAVQYRKVRFSWFSSRSMDKAYLEKGNRWIIDSSLARSEYEDDEDVIMAELEDITVEDIETQTKEVFEIGEDGDQFVL